MPTLACRHLQPGESGVYRGLRFESLRRSANAYGATFELTPREKGMNGSIARAKELLAATPGSWMPQQFENPANPDVHRRTTAAEVWNAYYADVFNVRDTPLLAIYSHMVSNPLYLADYPLGHIIAFQVGGRLTGPAFGSEFERFARQGRITPDAWMRGAVGQPISARPLLEAARKALVGTR